MVVTLSSSTVNVPFLSTVRSKSLLKCSETTHLQATVQRCQLHPIHQRKTSTICSAAIMSVRCGGAEQTQTITREAPTITRAPSHINEKSPDLDDGGTGLPPRDDDDGGGGGGGDGGNWSGGFFFFGFLALLGFLKDNESDDK